MYFHSIDLVPSGRPLSSVAYLAALVKRLSRLLRSSSKRADSHNVSCQSRSSDAVCHIANMYDCGLVGSRIRLTLALAKIWGLDPLSFSSRPERPQHGASPPRRIPRCSIHQPSNKGSVPLRRGQSLRVHHVFSSAVGRPHCRCAWTAERLQTT
jgi:hypothetical protein